MEKPTGDRLFLCKSGKLNWMLLCPVLTGTFADENRFSVVSQKKFFFTKSLCCKKLLFAPLLSLLVKLAGRLARVWARLIWQAAAPKPFQRGILLSKTKQTKEFIFESIVGHNLRHVIEQ